MKALAQKGQPILSTAEIEDDDKSKIETDDSEEDEKDSEELDDDKIEVQENDEIEDDDILDIQENDENDIDERVTKVMETSAVLAVSSASSGAFSGVVSNSGNAGLIYGLGSSLEHSLHRMFLFLGAVGDKIRRKGLFMNKKRKEIYDFILSNPGSHFRKILRATESHPNETVWHLRILEKSGFVRSNRLGRYLVYYPNENGQQIRFLNTLIRIR